MRIVFTVQAELDLEEIGDYIAVDNPARALSFVREIRDHCNRIAAAPLAYATRPELGEGIRGCAHGRYLIVFQSASEEVLIVRVLHSARDLPALFSDET